MEQGRSGAGSKGFSGGSIVEGEKGVGFKICQAVELIIVIILIVVAWGLLSLPAVFFYADTEQVSHTLESNKIVQICLCLS